MTDLTRDSNHAYLLPGEVDASTWAGCMTSATGIFCLTDDIPKKKVASIFRPPSPDVLAYLDFSVSTTGILAGVKVGPHERAPVSSNLEGTLRERAGVGLQLGRMQAVALGHASCPKHKATLSCLFVVFNLC